MCIKISHGTDLGFRRSALGRGAGWSPISRGPDALTGPAGTTGNTQTSGQPQLFFRERKLPDDKQTASQNLLSGQRTAVLPEKITDNPGCSTSFFNLTVSMAKSS